MESIVQLYGLAVVVLPVYGFVSLRKRIRYESLSKGAAMLRYAGLLLLPAAIYAALFGLALAVGSLTPFDPVSEETARSFPLAIALGLLVCVVGSLVFSLGLIFVRVDQARVRPEQQ